MTDPIPLAMRASHRYAKDWVLQNVELEARSKGVYGLLGSNGAGKSTLMNIACGVLNASSGYVWINGINLKEHPLQAKQHLGFLPQDAPLYPELTVDEYLRYCYSLRRADYSRMQQAVDAAKAKCGVAQFGRKLISSLSGGYRQRVGLAQAILHDPKVVVLDEPTNGLDPNQILGVRALIREIAEERVVLISTHILTEVDVLCDHIEMIEKGRKVFSGSIRDFRDVLTPSTVMLSFLQPSPAEELENVEGVESVQAISAQKFRLQISDRSGVASRLVKECCKAGWELEEIHYERVTLQDVFSQLSKTAH